MLSNGIELRFWLAGYFEVHNHNIGERECEIYHKVEML